MANVGFGIIGCGNIGPVHAAAIAQVRGAKLVAVSDVRLANAKGLADQYGAASYEDYREMLKRDDLHAVCICIPSGMRAEVAETCAAAGKHILSEKPLEVTSKRIDRIIKATEKAGVSLGCIFQSRFSDDAILVKKAIEQGRFGKLILGDAAIKWWRSQAYYDSGAWRGTWKLDGGGALMNQGIHYIDLLQWFMGPVSSVYARTALVGHTGLEVEDLAMAMLEFRNGAMGCIEGSTATYPGYAARIEIYGTEGSAILEDGKLVAWNFKNRKPQDKAIEAALGGESALGSGAADPLASLKTEGHRRQIEDFAKSIKKGVPPTINGREGRNAVALIEKIYESARTGKKVSL
jgi:predicted dehydrogenase